MRLAGMFLFFGFLICSFLEQGQKKPEEVTLFVTDDDEQAYNIDDNDVVEGLVNFKDIKERFTYDVRYGFLNLGEVHVYIVTDTVYRETPAIHVVTEMVSNRRLPLIGYKEVHYHTLMAFDHRVPYGLRFWQNSLHRNLEERYVYEFDYEAGHVLSYEEGELLDTLALDRLADGGPAIMYFSRLFAGTNTQTSYPVFINNEQAEITMSFSSEQVRYKSPAFPDEDIRAFEMEGYADFDGPFGFSGDFTALFMPDELKIPLEARVRIFVGSVRVRLIDYERIH